MSPTDQASVSAQQRRLKVNYFFDNCGSFRNSHPYSLESKVEDLLYFLSTKIFFEFLLICRKYPFLLFLYLRSPSAICVFHENKKHSIFIKFYVIRRFNDSLETPDTCSGDSTCIFSCFIRKWSLVTERHEKYSEEDINSAV